MPPLPSIFDQCRPRAEVLAGELSDSVFAADLWDVVSRNPHAHEDYRNPVRFFAGTYPTDNLKFLVREVAERLAGVGGGTPVYLLETGFGSGKTHALTAAVHVAREGEYLAPHLTDYGINRLPRAGEVRVAAFVGEVSDPVGGHEHMIDGVPVRTYTPWGQIALLAGGRAGFAAVRDNDLLGVAPERDRLEQALGDGPVLIVIDELVLYMARAAALQPEHPRHQLNGQCATFLQTLFSIAARRPQTVVLLTLPPEQDANSRVTADLKQFLPAVLDIAGKLDLTAGRQARNLTPTQSHERASVLGRRLFDTVDASGAADVAQAFAAYYQQQRDAGVQIESRAFEPNYIDQMRTGYPFHHCGNI